MKHASHFRARLALGALACSALAVAWRTAPNSAPNSAAAPPQDAARVVAHPVAGTVSYLTGRGGNIGVCAGPEGVVLVDDQFEPLAPQIRATIAGLSKAPLRFLLNTHFHPDHTGGNPVFGSEVPILAQENVRRRLQQPDREGQPPAAAMLEHGLPVITYEDGFRLYINGETLRVVHYPACHTDGDSVIFFERANVVHMGDLFFSGRFPFVDLDSGGSVRGTIAAVASILDEVDDQTKIIPGHGPLSSKADLAAYLEMLRTVQARVDAVTAEGATVEDMLRDDLFADYAEWGTGFVDTESFLRTLVRELSDE